LFDAKKYEAVNEHLHDLGVKLVSFGVPLAVGISILSGDIARILFGLEYQQGAAMLMPWLSAAIFVAVFKSYYLDVPFQLHNATKTQSYIAIVMAITNIVLNVILLPRYGVIAAAWSTLAAFIVGAFLSWAIGKCLFTMPNLKTSILKVSVPIIGMALVIFLMKPLLGIHWLIVKLALGSFTYLVLALLFDVANFRIFLRKLLRHSKRSLLK
jgi:O-antigen/teichoic acid export membrane protein